MKINYLSLIGFILFSLQAIAHGPTPQKAKQSETVNAPIDKVWQILKDFDQISNWHPDVTSSSGDGKNDADGTRTITLKSGGQLEESIDYYSDKDHEYNYRLKKENVDAFPVSFYTASLQLISDGNQTTIKWKSRFYRGDTGNFPSEKLNDEAAIKAMNDFIKNGLASLKAKFE